MKLGASVGGGGGRCGADADAGAEVEDEDEAEVEVEDEDEDEVKTDADATDHRLLNRLQTVGQTTDWCLSVCLSAYLSHTCFHFISPLRVVSLSLNTSMI